MSDQQLQEILTRLDALAAKIGVTVEQIWPWLIKQVYIDFYVTLAGCIFAMIVAITLVVIGFFIHEDNEEFGFCFGVVGLVFAVAWIILLPFTFERFTEMLNPEYAALERLLSMLGGV